MSKIKKRLSRKTAGNPPLLLALGDSIVWVQGPTDKFCSKVANSLNLQLQNRTYFGATVMCGSGPDDPITAVDYISPPSGDAAARGEIPRSRPTILEQAAPFDGDPDSVRLILVDGGINDVNHQQLSQSVLFDKRPGSVDRATLLSRDDLPAQIHSLQVSRV